MTAEIAVLNRQGVALAADSAVTVSGAAGTKVYNSANKLFVLSKVAPVGVMVYGNGQLTGVPWETVIKVYRGRLGARRFPHLADYASDLLGFLDKRNDLFPRQQQEMELLSTFSDYCTNVILTEIDTQVAQHLTRSPISRTQVGVITDNTIVSHARAWNKRKYLPERTNSHVRRVMSRWSSEIDAVIRDVFKQLSLTAISRNRLHRLAGLLFAKDRFPEGGLSGLVVAGFGEQEHFPAVVSYGVEGVVLERLKYRLEVQSAIDHHRSAAIIPFAQREMVSLFMEGIDPGLLETMRTALETVITDLPSMIAGGLALSAANKAAVTRQLAAAGKVLPKTLTEALRQDSRVRYVNPIVATVASLPKEELATMAETLVNLTSFKRRLTPERETVGGPIDVAVISKGDGFVWMKRKHYFDPGLNQRFMAQYGR